MRNSISLVVLLLVSFLGAPALAKPDLDQLRSSGVIAERFDGFAQVRGDGASGEVREFVSTVNAERRAIYEKRAAAENVSADQVGRVYAQKIFDKAPAGTWFLREDGSWLQKP